MAQIDPSATIVIDKSPAQTALMALFCMIFVLTSLWLLLGDFSGLPRVRALAPTIGGIGVAFFGFCMIVVLRRGLSGPSGLITLAPSGLTDLRVSKDEIPWSAVQNISTWSSNNQHIMVVKVAPDLEAELTLSSIAKMTRKANKALGADGLAIAASGLKTTHAALLDLTHSYAKAHGAPLV